MALDVGNLLDDLQKLSSQIGQAGDVIADIQSGKKKLAIVPGTGPSIVMASSGNIGIGIPAAPIMIGVVALGIILAMRKR